MQTGPDGFTGAVIAAEGVRGMKGLVNGPGGCRSRAQNLIRELTIVYGGEDPGCCQSKYMSKSTRLPCTHLNAEDIMFGSANKIADGISSVTGAAGSDLVLIDTLGASVQVTDRKGAAERSGHADRVILAEEDLAGMSQCAGFDTTMTAILQHLGLSKTEHVPNKVNILGYNIYDRSWDYGKKNFRELLGYLGLEVVCFVGCDCTEEELRLSAEASLNIAVHPENARRTAEYYEKELGIPCLCPSAGMPVGYDNIRSFIREVSEKTGTDPSRALKAVSDEEHAVSMILSNCDKACNSFRSFGMVLEGLPSDILPLGKFLYEYFSLVPMSVKAVRAEAPEDLAELTEFLSSIDCGDALNADVPDLGIRVILTDGLSAGYYAQRFPDIACVGAFIPSPENASLIDRSLVGLPGTRQMLDAVINGYRVFRCGQPTGADFR